MSKKTFWEILIVAVVIIAIAGIGLLILSQSVIPKPPPTNTDIPDNFSCTQNSDCAFTQCCGCARSCNKKCNIMPKAFPCECRNNRCVEKISEEKVTLTTDKIEYTTERKIKLNIKNNLNKDICFESCNTYIFVNKYGEPAQVPPLCLLNEVSNCIKPNNTEMIELSLPTLAGTYKISTRIYLDCKNKNIESCEGGLEGKIYSNEFTIKEMSVSASKNCNSYKMPMTAEEIKECICPEDYEKFNRLMGAYCATNSQKPCRTNTDCPVGEHCISDDGKNWFCTGQFAGCYFYDPENPNMQICAD